MGLYDTLYATCPNCAEILEFQSKVGECCLQSFGTAAVPPATAEDLEGSLQECQCGKVFKLSLFSPVTTVEMFLKEEN